MAFHLLKDYEMALKILEEFRKTQTVSVIHVRPYFPVCLMSTVALLRLMLICINLQINNMIMKICVNKPYSAYFR